MSNFIETYKYGQQGRNFGLTTGLPALDEAINGIQKKQSITVAAAPKAGKTTFVDFAFVLSPYLEMLAKDTLQNIQWLYYSFEIDRVSKEFKYAAFFMAYDYQQYNFKYKNKTYLMSSEYLMGKLRHRDTPNSKAEIVPVSKEHEEMLKEIYFKRIIPLFGEWSANNVQITTGKITFVEVADNPTGMYKQVNYIAKQNGEFVTQNYMSLDDHGNPVVKSRIVGYTPKNPDLYMIVVTDHVRKMRKERGFTMKENIDKWLEYTTESRNLTQFIFINVVHSGRQLANMERLKFAGEFIFPTADDTKDSGNFAEESTILMTLFNPNDEKYNLSKHFGVELKNLPNYRSIHITESRNTDCPAHIQTNMLGGINMFTPL